MPNLFDEHNEDCPCYDNEGCTFQVHYNQHVNDPRYDVCHEAACPVYFWIEKFAERVQ